MALVGLLALDAFTTVTRTKEIGLRKVNGATRMEVLILFIEDFMKWIGLSFILACPVSWYAMNKWLQSFAYKIHLSWWVFALAGILALVVPLVTVSWQIWKAASRNPVEALRYE